MEPLLFTVIAFGRLIEGGVVVALGWAWKRWSMLLWGSLTIALCIPVTALALGHAIAPGTALAISAAHFLAGMCVVAALLSSRGAVGRLRTLLLHAGVNPGETGWRP